MKEGNLRRPSNPVALFIRYFMFMLGLAVMAFGCVLTVQADIGVTPWDTFHIGLWKTFGLTIGTWSQIVGSAVILLTWVLAKIRPTLGMLLNMYFFGEFFDWFMWLDFVPHAEGIWQAVLLFTAGLLILSVGIGMYISPRLGAGPRDSLMLALHERLGLSIQRVRVTIEVVVLVAGYLMGGPVSVGTLLVAVLTGPLIQRTIPFWENVMRKPYGRANVEEQVHA
ncbi:YczE/YyaS/YitT family protein [Brevibacillus dissolubilis]|uniref:YczE/YyaS/YitT family protein n=1 Tax=Brevibacillus dissolubilis TaxID=1844116 RepID=UPI00159BEF30|nr:YitT family protein [Brevibacillus dissolubilis]